MSAPAPARHPAGDYSGGAFGRPQSPLLSRSWRIQRNVFAPANRTGGVAALLGQDAIDVAALTSGLSVYSGYNYGSFANWAALEARFGSAAKLVSITPLVQSAVPSMCLDIEPGNAGPSAAPGFQAQPDHGGATKPIYYCSAGDAHLVIAALSAAGHARSSYWLWLAHWLGVVHICGPAVCGYPQADATQYASTPAIDSDAWDAAVFASAPSPPPPNPHPALALTVPDTTDGPGAKSGPVHTLQERLNAWALVITGASRLAVDGDFGSETHLAVEAFQTLAFGPGPDVDGSVGAKTWAALDKTPEKPSAPSYGPPTGLEAVPAPVPAVYVRLTWVKPASVPGLPEPSSYEVFLYEGAVAVKACLAPGYPRPVTATSVVVSCAPGKPYTAHVVAGTGPAARPDTFATVTFTP